MFASYEEFLAAKKCCGSCPIGQTYKTVVQSDGNTTDPAVLIIGEAPGAEEVEQGYPFVGESGKVLRNGLRACGFTAQNTLITNVIPCRPENNQFPEDEKLVQQCMNKWLGPEILLTKPKFVLLVGSTPLKYVMKLEGITRHRGQWMDLKLGALFGAKALATFHPSYVIRKRRDPEGAKIITAFMDDLREVARAAGFNTEA